MSVLYLLIIRCAFSIAFTFLSADTFSFSTSSSSESSSTNVSVGRGCLVDRALVDRAFFVGAGDLGGDMIFGYFVLREEEDIFILLMFTLSRVLCTGESGEAVASRSSW